MSKLKIGDQAPKINAIDQNGATITLDQYRGKKVVLYFYPKDMTSAALHKHVICLIIILI